MESSIYQDPTTEAVTSQPVYSLLLRNDVEALLEFYDVVQETAKKSHCRSISAIKGMTPLRREVAITLENATRNKRLVEVSVMWQCRRHRDLAATACEAYLAILEKLDNDAYACHWLPVTDWIFRYRPAFNRIKETIAQTRN